MTHELILSPQTVHELLTARQQLHALLHQLVEKRKQIVNGLKATDELTDSTREILQPLERLLALYDVEMPDYIPF